MELRCPVCDSRYEPDEYIYRCKGCDEGLEVRYDYSEAARGFRAKLQRSSWGMWRYSPLPSGLEDWIVTMVEGGTPLHRGRGIGKALGLTNLFLKDESRNPTGSFKDRGTAVCVSRALQIGAKAVGCISTGNMAASTAAYAARAGLKSIVLMPSGVPIEKMVQTAICGTKLIAVKAPYPEIFRWGIEAGREHRIFMVHSDAPYRLEGQKTVAYEICEQLQWKVPDKVVVPTSSAGNVSAIWKGFKELHEMGMTDTLPMIVCIQAQGCSPIVQAFKRNADVITPFKEPDTLAQSISNPDPPSGKRALRILKESRGIAESVSDDEILRAQKLLAEHEGIFVEPASASAVAGTEKLMHNRQVDGDETIVCVLTGSGLKDVKSASLLLEKPVEAKSRQDLESVLRESIR